MADSIDHRVEYKTFIGRKIFFIISSLILLVLISIISTSLGSAHITIWDSTAAFLHRYIPSFIDSSSLANRCVWDVRLPRIIMGILAGAGLGISGCIMQAVLKNPLASPYTLGISSGAGFGASLAIISGVGIIAGEYIVIINAFVFALLCSFIIILLADRKGSTPETMILAGIALMYLFAALTTFVEYFGEAEAVKEAIFWMVGSLGKATWFKIYIVSTVVICSVPLFMLKSWDLNVLASGDETAKSLGVNARKTRIYAMVLSSLLVASIVAFTGTIGFIGLVAPHIVRMIIGGDNRFLIPASGIVGSILLVGADTVARTIIAPIIVPVGVMTAFLGVPVFLYLIMKRRREFF